MHIANYIDAVSMGASFSGGWIDISSLRGIGFQAKWTADAGMGIGSFTFDISQDTDPTRPVLGATGLTLPASMLVAGASPNDNDSSFFFDFTFRPAAKWMRMNYVRNSGTGTAYVGIAGVDR